MRKILLGLVAAAAIATPLVADRRTGQRRRHADVHHHDGDVTVTRRDATVGWQRGHHVQRTGATPIRRRSRHRHGDQRRRRRHGQVHGEYRSNRVRLRRPDIDLPSRSRDTSGTNSRRQLTRLDVTAARRWSATVQRRRPRLRAGRRRVRVAGSPPVHDRCAAATSPSRGNHGQYVRATTALASRATHCVIAKTSPVGPYVNGRLIHRITQQPVPLRRGGLFPAIQRDEPLAQRESGPNTRIGGRMPSPPP